MYPLLRTGGKGGEYLRRPLTPDAVRRAPTLRTHREEEEILSLEFFLQMLPPTATAQEHKVMVRNGKPVFFDPPEVKAARTKLTAYLVKHRPSHPLTGGIELVTTWCFPKGPHADGEYRITRPDTDNLQKLLKDCMTAAGFWKDDAQVCREIVEKFWADIPGIRIRVTQL